MNLQLLTTPWQRALGAMFKPKLGDTVLVFVYPHAAPRLFHSLFCPPMRILTADDQGDMEYDQVVSPGQFVKLPPTRIVFETDPDYHLDPSELQELVEVAFQMKVASGVWQADTSIDKLLFAMLRDAVGDMRRVHEAHHRNGEVRQTVLRGKFAPWERGQFSHSAGFLLNFSTLCTVPETAVRLSRQLLQVEVDCLDEITAASIAGVPWRGDFPARCLRCGGTASWRPVLPVPDGLATETAWRYDRPENHAPVCRRCAAWLGWEDQESLRVDLAQALWGLRFDAFLAWHKTAKDNCLPADWEKETYPLWPREYGGETWERGSGAFEYADPRPPEGAHHTFAHRAALSRIVNGRGGIRGKRGRGQFTPWLLLVNLVDSPLAEAS
jgi:hypothetical protein